MNSIKPSSSTPGAKSAKGTKGEPPRATRDDVSWQDEKSRLTRIAILDAAIQCIIDYGYASSTVEKIAALAKVSRGAMMHHFSSRAEIIESTAQFLNQRRLQEYHDMALRLRGKVSSYTIEHTRILVKKTYEYYNLPSYIAYRELTIAARTDPSLQEIMQPIYMEFDKRRAEMILELYPHWKELEKLAVLLTDFLNASVQGIYNIRMSHDKKERTNNLLELVAQQMIVIGQQAVGK